VPVPPTAPALHVMMTYYQFGEYRIRGENKAGGVRSL
jgi:hypothetical protein